MSRIIDPRKASTPDFFGVAIACKAVNRMLGTSGYRGFSIEESEGMVSLRKGRRHLFDAMKFGDVRKDRRTVEHLLEMIRELSEKEYAACRTGVPFDTAFLAMFDELLEHFCPGALAAAGAEAQGA